MRVVAVVAIIVVVVHSKAADLSVVHSRRHWSQCCVLGSLNPLTALTL